MKEMINWKSVCAVAVLLFLGPAFSPAQIGESKIQIIEEPLMPPPLALPLAASNAVPSFGNFNQSLLLTIGCSNTGVRIPTNMTISVCVSNDSQYAIGIGEPICDMGLFEVCITNNAGKAVAIRKQPAANGPGAGGARMNVIHTIHPKSRRECEMRLPLDHPFPPGKYTVILKRWCLVYLKTDDKGKVVSHQRMQLISNAISIEVL